MSHKEDLDPYVLEGYIGQNSKHSILPWKERKLTSNTQKSKGTGGVVGLRGSDHLKTSISNLQSQIATSKTNFICSGTRPCSVSFGKPGIELSQGVPWTEEEHMTFLLRVLLPYLVFTLQHKRVIIL
ncbi:unnamed protein product [Lactuca virosa]|uniref:Uncharacterized protein n=1 Tax=Lactuca virosa TaxID=75947 RepID=A0AAU9N1R6_9ASTR|nr:unnamed protein product [Lactuca virosa]